MSNDVDKLLSGNGMQYHEGVVRTDETCTDCRKVFIAKINYDLNGNHKINCPYCGHEHWRVIKNGVMTGDRWGSQNGPNLPVSTARIWSDRTVGIETNTAAQHIRDKFLKDREDRGT